MQHRTKGWYPDPMHIGVIRRWDGSAWTTDVMWGSRRYSDATPLDEVLATSVEQDATVVHAYLDDAARRGVLIPSLSARLHDDVDALVARVRPRTVATAGEVTTATAATAPTATAPTEPAPIPAPAPVAATPTPKATPAAPVAPAATPRHTQARPTSDEPARVATVATAPAAQEEPGLVAAWWERTRSTMKSDLAVHGLAYLGVVLLFAGVFGLIAFSFGDVDRNWRLVALVAAPSACFLAGWYLGRRGATAVSSALVVLGASVLPVAAVASVTDGAAPDITGPALPITQAALCAVIALGELALLRRVPVLRWVVAPTLWLGTGLLLGVVQDPVPTGEAVVRADALQIAAIVAAIAVTLVVVRRRPEHALCTATTALALPLAAGLTIVEVLVAATEGWPVLSGVITAIAALVVVECTPRLGVWTAPMQSAFVAAACLRLLPEVRPAWVALTLFVSSLVMVEAIGARRTERGTVHLPLLLAVAGAALAMLEPMPGLIAATLVTAWATWRRLDAPAWLPYRDDMGVSAAVGTVAMTVMAARWIELEVALFVAAALVALVGLAGRTVTAVERDRMCRWWTPSAAGALVVATLAIPWDQSSRTLAITALVAALGACTLAISHMPVAARVWATAGATAWMGVAIGRATELSLSTEAVVLAALAVVAVAVGTLVDRAATAHIALVGHLAGFTAVGLAHRPGAAMNTTLILLAATWWSLTLLHEMGRVAHFQRLLAQVDPTDALLDGRSAVHCVPALIAVTTTTATVMLQLSATSPWLLVPIGAAGTVVALATRLPWRRASTTVLAWAAFAAAALGIAGPVAAGLPRLPTLVALGLALVTTGSMARRHVVFLWSAWAVTGPIAVLALEAAGMSRRWSDVAFAAWGTGLLLGAATIDRARHGRAATTEWGRSAALRAPMLLGAAAVLAGGAGAMVDEPQWGWVLLGMSAVTMAVAALHPLAPLSGVALTGALVAAARLVPWVLDHPWSFAAASWALAVTAWAVPHRARPLVDRWDLPPFVVAHLTAVVALAGGVIDGEPTAPFLMVAAVAAGIAVVLRAQRWSLAHAAIAEALVLATAVHHGPGWLSLACIASATGLTVAALLRKPHAPNPTREVMLAAGTVFTAAAWTSFAVWRDLPSSTMLVASAAICATVIGLSAMAVRFHLPPRDLFAIWGLAALAGVAGTAILAGQHDVDATLAQWTFAAVAVVLSASAAAAAREIHPVLRWLSAAALWGAAVLTSVAIDIGPTPTLVVAIVVASATALAAMALHSLRPTSSWVGPWLAFAGAVQATGLAHLDTSRSELVALVLLVIAAQLVAIAFGVGERYVLLLSPLFALAAWLVVAADSLRGDPNWFTLPVGVVLLVEVAMVRWVRRTRPGATYSADVNGALVTLEFVAMAVMVGPLVTRLAGTELWYAVPSIVLGAAITIWGGVTRVRRRAAFGVGTLAVTVTLLIGVPIAQAVPEMSGPALWLTIAGMGLVAIVVATMLEQGRAVVRRWAAALDDLTSDWEHLDGADTAPRGARPGPGAPTAPPVVRQR